MIAVRQKVEKDEGEFGFIVPFKAGKNSTSLSKFKYHKMEGVKIFAKNGVCLQASLASLYVLPYID